MRTGAGQLAALDNQVLVADGAVFEVALQDLTGACGITGLGRQAGAGDVGCHGVVGHGPPRMVRRRWLREPHVACIAGQLAALQRGRNGIAVAQLAACGVDQVGAALEVLQRLGIDHVLRLGVKRAIERDHVAYFGQAVEAGVVSEVQLLLDGLRQAVAIHVVQLHVVGLQ